jgi:hypothetical protein
MLRFVPQTQVLTCTGIKSIVKQPVGSRAISSCFLSTGLHPSRGAIHAISSVRVSVLSRRCRCVHTHHLDEPADPYAAPDVKTSLKAVKIIIYILNIIAINYYKNV